VVLEMKDPVPREEEISLQFNDQAFTVRYEALDPKVFESIKDLELPHKVWKRLEESYEGTSTMKDAKLYILKVKYAKFKMVDGESVPKMCSTISISL